jgi:hypothetical protein
VSGRLGSRDVARVIYGAVIGLALVVVLQDHPPPPGVAAAQLLATALAVGLAELYSEAVGDAARNRRPVERARLRPMAVSAAAVVLGAAFPAVYLLLAAVGLIEIDTAFTLAKWTGLGLLTAYGFAGARLSGLSVGRSLVHAVVIGIIGFVLVALKALLH